ncbi:phage terminase family protein [Collinsella sp. zg1085]|uniref:phage terminase family protein n=1 Tax=Collinsella sp. zg1085 TaxID=2844380 RepID=UPI001C0BE79A|nr:phage terminase family protein [Collinsella sp. zg1085]QWT18107.1 phage terminase family protein [Collinsella sp. zg1085]
MLSPRLTPTFVANIPEHLDGDGAMAVELAGAYFGKPLPWQPYLLHAMLARDDADKYLLRTLGISIPRQNGKSWVVRARCFYGALAGEKILFTCQHGDTAMQMFEELAAPFEDENLPELHSLLDCVRKTNGQQSIRLKKKQDSDDLGGGLIRFTTRTDSLARGRTYDVLIYDEAQDLTARQQAASLPAISAGPMNNPQTIYLGTPPAPENIGTIFKDLHKRAHEGTTDAAWIEWAAPEIGDIHDKTRWYEYNPSLGTQLNYAAVETEASQMPSDVFARERLGWWSASTNAANLALSGPNWERCCVDEPIRDGKIAFGVKFSPDGQTVAVSWARAKRGCEAYIELYDVQSAYGGTVGISEMLTRNQDRIAAVCIDGKSGSGALIQRLHDASFPKKAIIQGSSSIVQSAAAMLCDEVNAQTIKHIASPALDVSATKSIRRKVGDFGGWSFGDGEDSISAPIESAALALYAIRTTKRDPEREQGASF